MFVGYAASLNTQIIEMVMHIFQCLMNVSEPSFTEM